jgi:hypothetical protein
MCDNKSLSYYDFVFGTQDNLCKARKKYVAFVLTSKKIDFTRILDIVSKEDYFHFEKAIALSKVTPYFCLYSVYILLKCVSAWST